MEIASLLVRLRRFAGWAWFIGGVATVGVAIAFAIPTATFIHEATETSGQILSLLPVTDGENHTVNYAPVFAFIAADGRSYTITSSTSTNPPGFAVGQTVRVLYDSQNPTNARLKSTAQLWMVPLICAPLGLFLSVLGGMLLLFDRRYRSRLASTMSTAIR